MNHSVSLPPIAKGSGAAGAWAELVTAMEAKAMTAEANRTLRMESSSRIPAVDRYVL
jgi:hypothetical protein